MAVLPAEVPSGLVTGQFYFVSSDGDDADTNPELEAVTGVVRFTASAKVLRIPSKRATLIPLTFDAKFNGQGQLTAVDDPSIGLRLPATDSDLINPKGYTWQVEFHLKRASDGHTVPIDSFAFAVPAGGEVDLTEVMPIAVTAGVQTIQGPPPSPEDVDAALGRANLAGLVEEAVSEAGGGSGLIPDPANPGLYTNGVVSVDDNFDFPKPVSDRLAKPVSARFAEVERQQSYARARIKANAKAPLPTSPTQFSSASSQASRISFPNNWSHDTPIPLVIQFRGLDATGDAFQQPTMAAAANELGYAFAVSAYHGNSYGSPAAIQDALDLYRAALKLAPISGVVLWGNSMGGVGALNSLTTGAFPDPLGIYLTDPVVSLRQRYDNGRSAHIIAAYGLASNGSDYAAKTAGFDPALEMPAKFRGTPISIVASSGDTSVPLASHGTVLFEKLNGYSPIEILDTKDAGHNTSARFRADHFKAFLLKCVGSTAALPDQAVAPELPTIGPDLDYEFDSLRASIPEGSAITALSSSGNRSLTLDRVTAGSTKPTLIHSGPGGHAALSFSGTNLIASGTGDPTAAIYSAGEELTFVLVAKIQTKSESVRIVGVDNNPTPANYRYIKPLTGGGVASASSSGGSPVTSLNAPDSIQNAWVVIVVSQGATESFMKVNNRVHITGSYELGQMHGLRLGATGSTAPAASSFFTGQIARFQIYKRPLTPSEASSVVSEMMAAYGIAN